MSVRSVSDAISPKVGERAVVEDNASKTGLSGSVACRVKDAGGGSTNREDFLKATMRIFLVVSPPMGKIQVRTN